MISVPRPLHLLIWALVALFLSSCASMTEAEKEEYKYAQNERAAKWEVCKRLYGQLQAPWYSNHSHGKGMKHMDYEVKDDLRINRCPQLLCKAQLWECTNTIY